MRLETSEKTFNKNVKETIKNNFSNKYSIRKSHVAGIGYVYFVKDENNNILGKAYKGSNGFIVEVKEII